MHTRRAALTTGAIARELEEPIHRIEHVIRTRGIEPEYLAGHIRVFGADVVERIAEILRSIDHAQAHHAEEAGTLEAGMKESDTASRPESKSCASRRA